MQRLETHVIHITIHLYDEGDSELSHNEIITHKPLTVGNDSELLQKVQALQQELHNEFIARVQDPKDKLKKFRFELVAQQSPVLTIIDNRGLQFGTNKADTSESATKYR